MRKMADIKHNILVSMRILLNAKAKITRWLTGWLASGHKTQISALSTGVRLSYFMACYFTHSIHINGNKEINSRYLLSRVICFFFGILSIIKYVLMLKMDDNNNNIICFPLNESSHSHYVLYHYACQCTNYTLNSFNPKNPYTNTIYMRVCIVFRSHHFPSFNIRFVWKVVVVVVLLMVPFIIVCNSSS